MVSPLVHKPLREIVADELRKLIVDGDLAPGERLYEDRLAERLGVSRNPVREAIRSLEALGLVVVQPRRGAYVVDMDVGDIRKMQEVRRVLDRWIVEMATERHDDDDLARIDACITNGRIAAEAGDPVRAAAQHREFHLAIEAATKNPYITVAMDPIRQRAELVFSMLAHHRGSVGWDAHQAIRDAIADRDRDRACRLMDEHIVEAIDEFEVETTASR
jgi:DNA-binding GntR family transcriptional regulator